ncbi:MAG: carbohydrate ABC transporter permease [Ruminiclostridium sp.]|nr:carbohydrate ABC transporter permease [Ruminiclostridium sp.]
MAKKDNNLEKNNTAPVTPEVTDTKEAVTENSEAPAQAVIENHATEALKDTVVKVSDDDAREEKKYTKKELKELEKQRKALHKQYHISNIEIIRNYKTYSDAEKKHYRYIFGRRVSDKVWPVFRFIILFGLAFVILKPMLFMISCSLRPQYEMNDPSIMWIPKTLIFSNFSETWQATHMGSVLWNTISVNVICSLLQVVTCAITGYGFARFKFKGRGLLFVIVILQIIVPTQVILIPQFMQFRYFDVFGIISMFKGGAEPGLNLTDSPMALYLQAFFVNGIRAGLFILLFRQFFRGLPKELEDAAHLDGCGPFATFIRIMVPNAKTSFLTVFIFSLVWYWNDSYVSNMFFADADTIALQIGNLYTTISSWLNGGTPTGVAADFMVWIEAGCLISLLPILIIYCFLQRQFIEGIERSGITGM